MKLKDLVLALLFILFFGSLAAIGCGEAAVYGMQSNEMICEQIKAYQDDATFEKELIANRCR